MYVYLYIYFTIVGKFMNVYIFCFCLLVILLYFLCPLDAAVDTKIFQVASNKVQFCVHTCTCMCVYESIYSVFP